MFRNIYLNVYFACIHKISNFIEHFVDPKKHIFYKRYFHKRVSSSHRGHSSLYSSNFCIHAAEVSTIKDILCKKVFFVLSMLDMRPGALNALNFPFWASHILSGNLHALKRCLPHPHLEHSPGHHWHLFCDHLIRLLPKNKQDSQK